MPDTRQILLFGGTAVAGCFVAYAQLIDNPFASAPPPPPADTPIGHPCDNDYQCHGVYGLCPHDKGEPGFCSKVCDVPSVTAHPMLDPGRYNRELEAQVNAESTECPETYSCTGTYMVFDGRTRPRIARVCMPDAL